MSIFTCRMIVSQKTVLVTLAFGISSQTCVNLTVVVFDICYYSHSFEVIKMVYTRESLCPCMLTGTSEGDICLVCCGGGVYAVLNLVSQAEEVQEPIFRCTPYKDGIKSSQLSSFQKSFLSLLVMSPCEAQTKSWKRRNKSSIKN